LQIFASAGLIYLVINWVVALAGNVIERSLPGVPR
jgi:polar amino acid transport system permease protein